MAENDMEALAAKLKKTESDLVRIGWLDDADNVREAFTALRSTTAEPVDEARALEELALLYNHSDSDEPQFTRWQMVVAMKHGARLSHPTDSAAKDAEIARAADLMKAIQHSVQMAMVPGNDWRRELRLIQGLTEVALANRGEAGSLAKERDRD